MELDMPLIQDLLTALEQQIPLTLAESWDNVGLLLGDAGVEARGVMTCLTLTEEVAEEAIREGANLVITHHPILFKAVKRLTTDTNEGRMLLKLIRAGVSVYSPHTAFDSAREGINQQIAVALGLNSIQPIRVKTPSADGAGRWGQLAVHETLSELLRRLKTICPAEQFTFVGDLDQRIETVAIACGAAGDFLPDAAALGCQVFITGETRFHTCLEARSLGVALVMVGHYASERPAVEELARRLAVQWRPLRVWASRSESDPVSFHLS
jgi:dinuclear metal center YbgI/SA1388 family protein